MAKGTTKQHHCVGKSGWVGKISPGGCMHVTKGKVRYCSKHEMICKGDHPLTQNSKHLQNEPGCMQCIGGIEADERCKREEAEEERKKAQKNSDDAFWNPPKDRKKK